MDERTRSVYKTIADNVLRLRGRMSQTELALKAGVSRSTIANVEACRGLSIDALVKIAYALDVLPSTLLAIEGHAMTINEFLRTIIREELAKHMAENCQESSGGGRQLNEVRRHHQPQKDEA